LVNGHARKKESVRWSAEVAVGNGSAEKKETWKIMKT